LISEAELPTTLAASATQAMLPASPIRNALKRCIPRHNAGNDLSRTRIIGRQPRIRKATEGPMNRNSYVAINVNDLPWEERFHEKVGKAIYRKELFTDPDTGMLVRLVRYPAGVINPRHTHPCGHGMYVLEGQLVTHKGSYGPGSFVWFPEGEVMEHGASSDGDVIAVFITNKPFRIDYEN
jgi:quercetin dioxygenase-like cupin family protein